MKKYQLVAQKIKEHINKNNLQQGDKLPKIAELMERFQVGKSTILQALSLLDQEGVVYKVQGAGIFVRMPAKKGYMTLGADLGFAISFSSTDVYKKDVKVEEVDHAPEDLAKDWFPLEPAYKVMRTICDKRGPLLREESYYLKRYVSFLTEALAEGSLFKYIQDALGLEIRFADQYLKMRKLTDEEAKLLDCEKGDPTLEINEIHYLANGEPFDLAKLVYNYKNVEFINQSPDKII